MNAAGVTPLKDCLSLTFDTRGYYYEIPNYCINFPFKYEIGSNIENKVKPENKIVFVIVRKTIEDQIYDIEILQKVIHLKEKISQNFLGQIIDVRLIRLFYAGKELNDNEELWTHKIEDDSIIMLMIRQVF